MSYRGILISGASSGIGAALALELARPGIVLGLLGRDPHRLAAIADQARARGAECQTGQFDLRDQSAVQEFVGAFAALTPIDLVIANAGVLDGRKPDGALETAEAARQLLEINLLTTLDVFHLVLPHVRATHGQILLVASLAGLAPLPDAPAYSASKAGLISYGLAMREALRGEGVRISVICPGYVTTAMTQQHLGAKPFEISAQKAAQKILVGARANRALIGFPWPLYLSSRLSIAAPEWLRRLGMRGLGFRVADRTQARAPETRSGE